MRISRLYIDSKLEVNQEVILPKEAQHYLQKVLRLKTNDEIIVFNGKGGEYLASIREDNKKLILQVKTYHSIDRESCLSIDLIVCLIRSEKMDLVIQKAVELGVKNIIAITCNHSVLQLETKRIEKKLQHWQGIIQSACEQCGRTLLPKLWYANDLPEALPFLSLNSLKLLLEPKSDNNINTLDKPEAVSIWIGPEGGFSEQEIMIAQQAGFIPLTLGSRILRAETASIAALTVVQALWGDLLLL